MNEIIIDGCNVAECKHFEDADCLNPAETVLSCESQPNCLFKQLQRLEAEKQEKVLKMAEAEVEIEKLQAENEKLKENLSEAEAIILTYKIERDNQKQALEDIREILCYGRTFYDGYFDSDKLSRTDEVIKRVNEVLNEG